MTITLYYFRQTELKTKKNNFNVALLEKEGKPVEVDFRGFNISEGDSYKIYDLENRNIPVKSGTISNDLKVEFPMSLSEFERPLHNTIAIKSADNFGVYRIEFKESKI